MVEKISNDWRKDLLDDKNFEQKTHFNFDLCINLLEECGENLEKLNPYVFLRPIWEITKAFRALSVCLSVGFSDITSKVQVWRDLIKNIYKEENTIQEIVEKEISLNIHELNGENNRDKGHKKKTTYYEYVSGTRTLLRLTWFLDFFSTIIQNSFDMPDKSFCDCIRAAYEKALAPHHPWIVRKASAIGISLAPSKREKAMLHFLGKEAWDDEIKGKLARWKKITYKIWEYLNNYYQAKKLLELP